MKKFKAPFKKNEYQPHHPYAQWKSYLKLLVYEVFSINIYTRKAPGDETDMNTSINCFFE